MPMGSLLGRDKIVTADKDKSEELTTGSVKKPSTEVSAVLSEKSHSITVPIASEDWDFAKKALIEALSSPSETPSVPWENEKSGMRGTVTALHRSGGAGGAVCRPFLGSAVKDKAETWFEGRACRMSGSEWEMQDLRPWKKS